MAGRHLCNGSITAVGDSIGGRNSNEVYEISSLDNTTVSQEAETEGTVVIAEWECSNSDSKTEVSVGMWTRKLQDLLTNIPYPTAFPYGNGMVLHFYQQQESSTTKTVHKVINKGLKTYV